MIIMGIHEGHRDRLKESFRLHGLESMNDLNALELLLFYAIPRRDTNPIAHRLLDRFGSLDKVLEASEMELMDIPGIGESAATLIRLVPQFYKKSRVSASERISIISGTDEAVEYLRPRFADEKDEIVIVLFLDNKQAVIRCEEMGRGVVNAVDTSVRRIVETALKYKATGVYLSHNHPGGTPMPSREDDMFTRRLYSSLELISIPLLDHIIFADNKYISLSDSGAMRYYRF